MDTYGNFTVTWSGQGESNQDTDGHGVYYQRYDRGATRIGSQTLVNLDTEGDQWISSIGMDARGNFVIAWTGEGALPGTTAIYKYDSINNFPQTDNDGPIVTDVYYGTERIFNGSVIAGAAGEVTQMTVVFNEDLSVLGGDSGLNSVLNPDNWALVKNDVEIVGAILSVDFGLNPLTNKYEATIYFDGNGVNFGTPGLDEGEYVLTVRDLITDTARYVDPDADTNEVHAGQLPRRRFRRRAGLAAHHHRPRWLRTHVLHLLVRRHPRPRIPHQRGRHRCLRATHLRTRRTRPGPGGKQPQRGRR